MQGFRDGKVFAFEPSPEHINVIALDIDQNLLEDRVFIVPNGLGEFTNPMQGIDSSLSAIADTGNSVANVEDAAPILALEDFLAVQGIDRRDCIKLDVEGFELKALKGAATPWEAEIDKLMQTQALAMDPAIRKRAFDRVQAIVAEQAPFIYLIHRNSMVGVSPRLRGVQPALLRPQLLWNVPRLYLQN